MAEVVAAGKSDADVAVELKAEMLEALKPVAALLAKAGQRNMLIEWNGFTCDQFGRWTPNNLRVMRQF